MASVNLTFSFNDRCQCWGGGCAARAIGKLLAEQGVGIAAYADWSLEGDIRTSYISVYDPYDDLCLTVKNSVDQLGRQQEPELTVLRGVRPLSGVGLTYPIPL